MPPPTPMQGHVSTGGPNGGRKYKRESPCISALHLVLQKDSVCLQSTYYVPHICRVGSLTVTLQPGELSSFPFPTQGGAGASILRGGEEPCLPTHSLGWDCSLAPHLGLDLGEIW